MQLSQETIEAIAAVVVERLRGVVPAVATVAPEWADKFTNPYGSERAFLDAARRGEFKTFRRCRRVTARWADVAAAIERKPHQPRAAQPVPAEDVNIDELLASALPRRHPRTEG